MSATGSLCRECGDTVIADRIEADIALPDALAGDADLENGHDAEAGIADAGGEAEQHGCVWFGCREEFSSIDGRPLCRVAGILVSEAHA